MSQCSLETLVMPETLSIKVVIGFDFGMKRIGTAVGQAISLTASPLKTLAAKDGVPDWHQLSALLLEWQPQALVVGVPCHINGQAQHTTFAAKKFAKKLRHKFDLPVYEVDERLTTVEARAMTFDAAGYKGLKKQEMDSVAAALITEQWLSTMTV